MTEAALPYGIFSRAGEPRDNGRAGVRNGDHVLDLYPVAKSEGVAVADVFNRPALNDFMALGLPQWRTMRERIRDWLDKDRYLIPVEEVRMHLPFAVADYVDFYSSEQHAINLGRMFRPDSEPLTPNWRHLPIGYHGRSGTIVVGGTPIRRPRGQIKPGSFEPCQKLDFEAEVGFVVGVPSEKPIPVSDFAKHVFGVCLVNDWSARDIQSFEYVPLGPFLGKSFATSISPWIVPLEALEHARVNPPPRDPPPVEPLDDAGAEPWGLDLSLEVSLNEHVLSRPPFKDMYWTPAQQLAHMTSNGATVRTGDLFASGTVSGSNEDQRGSMIELSWNGTSPVKLPDGSTRTFLEDGDEVVIRATAGPVSFGDVRGRIEPA